MSDTSFLGDQTKDFQMETVFLVISYNLKMAIAQLCNDVTSLQFHYVLEE